jgi:phosphohistidine phosphatase
MSTSEDRASGAGEMAEQQAPGLLGGDLREGYAEVGDVRLHYVRPGVVLCSSSLRTRQTLAAILPALGDALEIRIEPALYGAGAAELLGRLQQVSNRASSAMLIGHNPGIQDLALALAAGGPARAGLREKFPTGALATVELDVERWRDIDNGTVTALVTPRSLEAGTEA